MFGSQRHEPDRSRRIGPAEDARRSPATAPFTERDLVEKHLQELYDFNRGALYSNSLIQAQTAFEQGDFVKTLELVKASRELFEKRHKKTLQQDPKKPDGKRRASKKERLALEGKQSRIKEIIGIFDEVLKPLETMAKLQRLAPPKPAAKSDAPREARPPARRPEGFQAEYGAAETDDGRYRVICRHFDVEPVSSDQDIRPDTLYYVRGKESHLIRSSQEEARAEVVAMTVVPSGQRMKPIARRKLLELGAKAQLLRLVPKAASAKGLESSSAQPDQDSVAEGSQLPAGPEKSYSDTVIDVGLFTQLLAAARQSEIVPNADQIAHVRDREFRMGKHQTAFRTIDRLSVKFNQAAAQREQKLRAEEMAYRAGTLKMSPKQWQLKKQRDTLQTQKIERTRRNFTRVLDGLRILIVSGE